MSPPRKEYQKLSFGVCRYYPGCATCGSKQTRSPCRNITFDDVQRLKEAGVTVFLARKESERVGICCGACYRQWKRAGVIVREMKEAGAEGNEAAHYHKDSDGVVILDDVDITPTQQMDLVLLACL